MTNAPQVAGRWHEWTRGDRLRVARESLPGGLSQEQFGKLIGISRNTVGRYESDHPGSDKYIVIKAWADATGYDYAWLDQGIVPAGGPGGDGGGDAMEAATWRYPVLEAA